MSLVSGGLLSLAWPERGFPGFLFIGFVPLLWIENHLFENRTLYRKLSAFYYSYPAFLAWNGLTTWWICNSTGIGAIMAVILNSMFMALIFQMFHFTRSWSRNPFIGYFALVCYWISFEYLHLNWELNWPWLNLGNGFGSWYKWVQWYEYTGALGGTLWVLVANILGFELFWLLASGFWQKKASGQQPAASSLIIHALLLASWILLPIILSVNIYKNYKEESHPVNVVVVQPNLDPYKEQYSIPPSEVIARIMQLASPLIDSTTNFLVAPESALQQEMWENDMESFESIRILHRIVTKYPNLNFLIGGSTFYEFQNGAPLPHTARKFGNGKGYYNAYNTAIMVNGTRKLQLYHKSKLTPGVESLPSYKGFSWLEKYAIDLGGIVGSLGTDTVRKVYQTFNSVPAGPTICYESIFGEFFAEFVRNGAQVMFIITNDGWWGNTAGHRQHYAFAHLRAIETRRCIARSANTGISAFIDQRGDASQVTKYWEPAAIKGTINSNNKRTFYVMHGDLIARIAVWAGLLVIIGSMGIGFFKRKS
ncbi:MAG: apolipoprotein N-acyltransferase [Bacteroidota bacterium]